MVTGGIFRAALGRFVTTTGLAVFVLALPFRIFAPDDATVWDVIAFYLICILIGVLDVIRYVRRRKQDARDGVGWIEQGDPSDLP
jgi:hypothetical protein